MEKRAWHKNAQQCWSGTCQILTVEVSNYYIKQKNCISTHLYGYVNILGLSTGLLGLTDHRSKVRAQYQTAVRLSVRSGTLSSFRVWNYLLPFTHKLQ